KRLASKVVADMHQCCRLYGRPSTNDIAGYQEELIVLLADGYVAEYEFGFKKDDARVLSWKYKVTSAGALEGGRSGGLYAQASVASASMFNYLWYSSAWSALTLGQQQAIDAKHAVSRVAGDPPKDGSGHWVRDRTYVSGGVAVQREEFLPW